jgi:hypothetical protein
MMANTVFGARSGTSGSYKVTGVYFVDGANKSVSGAQLYYKNKGSILKDSAYAARNVFDSTGKMLLGAWSQYDWKTVANLKRQVPWQSIYQIYQLRRPII